MIHVQDLTRVYHVPHKEPGLRGALRGLFKRRVEEVRAVDRVSFTVEPGACVGFLGPNGAGKTTTLKMLSGLLHPTSGSVSIFGHTPHARKRGFLTTIALVMGQKQQLIWDLPPRDTFDLNRAIYHIDPADYRRTLDDLVALLDLGALLDRPTRNLSLGERMKCELCAALLHRPRVLFLDEPTIGLDVAMQATLREFIRDYNRQTGATILLTTHYMNDVEALCPRVILIDQGTVRYDGALDRLVADTLPDKRVTLRLTAPPPPEALAPFGHLQRLEGDVAVLLVPRQTLQPTIARLLTDLPVADLSVDDPPLEDVMRRVFLRNTPPADPA